MRSRRLHWRAQLFAILHKPEPGNIAARYANYFLAALILVNAAAVAIESVSALRLQWGVLISDIETISTALFVIEYLSRLWVCVEQGRFSRPVLGRLRYALRPLSLLDFVAIATYWTPWDLRFLRVARLVRLLKVLHLNEFEAALERLSGSLRRRRELLIVSITLMISCVYVAAAMLYHLEHARQAQVFSSIPATFWWACESFTTIGYGDMIPLTALGRFCAALISVLGIGVFALPSAIITAAIIESSAVTSAPVATAVCEACGHRHGDSKP